MIQESLNRAKGLNIDLLDAQLFLMQILNCSRAQLISHSENKLSPDEAHQFDVMLKRRAKGEPVAYILGKKSFWDLDLLVNPGVLVPRPETEMLVEWVLNSFSSCENTLIADLGTGSGAIALSLAKAKPHWRLVATDFSSEALQVAKQNANVYQLNNVEFYKGSWCEALPVIQFDVIISNPPYIDEQDVYLQGDIRFEPRSALVASDEGFADLLQIAKEAQHYLIPSGYLVLEHGWTQADRLRNELIRLGYEEVQTFKDLAGYDRMTVGKNPHPGPLPRVGMKTE